MPWLPLLGWWVLATDEGRPHCRSGAPNSQQFLCTPRHVFRHISSPSYVACVVESFRIVSASRSADVTRHAPAPIHRYLHRCPARGTGAWGGMGWGGCVEGVGGGLSSAGPGDGAISHRHLAAFALRWRIGASVYWRVGVLARRRVSLLGRERRMGVTMCA